MGDFIYGEYGEVIETNFELNYQYDNEAFNDFSKDNAGIEYDYEELM